MRKLNYTDITDQQIIDIRPQHAYQSGHMKDSLNLNLKNFKKYASDFLSLDQEIVFIIDEEKEMVLDELSTLAQEQGLTQVKGYIRAEDIPKKHLQQIETIPVEDFLNKKDDYILLDVRNPAEITRPAPEKNLMNIPLEDLTNSYQSLDSSKEIYTLCGSGNRATTAASFLATKGYKPLIIEGGMKAVQEKTQ